LAVRLAMFARWPMVFSVFLWLITLAAALLAGNLKRSS
jgi:hypothetical protein